MGETGCKGGRGQEGVVEGWGQEKDDREEVYV
jgi:hypothetical protein